MHVVLLTATRLGVSSVESWSLVVARFDTGMYRSLFSTDTRYVDRNNEMPLTRGPADGREGRGELVAKIVKETQRNTSEERHLHCTRRSTRDVGYARL